MLHPTDFFELNDERAAELFTGCDYVWQVLPRLKPALNQWLAGRQTVLGRVMPGAYVGDQPVFIGEGAVIEPGAYVQGPAYIGPHVVVRHGALLREDVILLAGSVLGHASEAKNSLFLPGAHAPHFAYVGDSVLGQRVNLGAGTKLSNLTMMSEKDKVTGKRPTIQIEVEGVIYDTGLAKMGAILGDEAQTGCNSVLNPGCLVGRRTLVYANLSLRKGYYPAGSIVKLRQEIVTVGRQ
ncbi:MAG: glucose-1-phosphate thymidylyltransferase [Chloroflexota bacterium]